MDGLRQYATTLIIGALICGIVQSLTHGSTLSEAIKFLCSIFLSVLLLRPLCNGSLTVNPDFLWDYQVTGNSHAQQGISMANQTREDIITAEIEAYIRNIAAQTDTELTVSVILNEEQLPIFATMEGSVTEQCKEKLEERIEQDLGITKENQLWTG